MALIKQFELWIADLSPKSGTEPGKKRPVVVVQSNLLNKVSHPSTIICPITSRLDKDSRILRINLKKDVAGLDKDCAILIDQIRSIDNRRLIQKIGVLPKHLHPTLKENLLIVLDLF